MVKGISRRVVVVDSPDPRFFEQAIFIVRNYAAGDHSRLSRAMRDLNPALYTIMGAAGIGLVWLTVTLV